jgi:hypothetical protein
MTEDQILTAVMDEKLFGALEVDLPLVREEPFLFCTLVGFQILTITKARGKTIADVDKLQLLCFDTHKIVVPFHGILDLVTVHQSRKNIYLHGVDVGMIFEEIQQRLDQDLEEYKDDEEREREEKKHHLYQLKQQLEQYLQELRVVGFNTGNIGKNPFCSVHL